MSAARSICTGCARGCNVYLDYMREATYRYRPRENEAVNQEWMCDSGRLSYKYLNAGRVLAAREGRGASAKAATAEAAAARAGPALKAMARGGALAALFSPLASLEDLLAAALVATEGLGLTEVHVGGRPDGWHDDFLKVADENPNRRGLELVAQAFGLRVRPFGDLVEAIGAGRVKGVWAVGEGLPDPAAAAAFAKLEVLVVQAVNDGPLAQQADVLLPAAPHSETDGTFVSFQGRAQRFELAYWPRGGAKGHWALAGEIGASLGLARRWKSPREVFDALGSRLGSALGEFAWDALKPVGRFRGLSPGEAGTVDGRLPGQRERVPADSQGNVDMSLFKVTG